MSKDYTVSDIRFEDMKVYIASPFFNEEQLKPVIELEELLDELGVQFHSPRQVGVLKEMTEEQRGQVAGNMFDSNIYQMDKANIIIAILDSPDSGTAFEHGYFYRAWSRGERVGIITLKTNGTRLNIMMKTSTHKHVNSIASLKNLLDMGRDSDISPLSRQLPFNPEMDGNII